MKLIIFISSRLRNGQFPRLPDFSYSHDHGRYIYAGKELTPEEFNVAAEKVFNERYRGNGFQFCASVVTTVENVEVVAAPVVVEQPKPQSRFTLDDKAILLDGTRIAGIYGSGQDAHLRVLAEWKDIRSEIEDWLKSQNLLPQ